MNTTKKTLLFLETRMTGHRPSYLRRATKTALKEGYTVLLGLPEKCFKHSVIKDLATHYPSDQLVLLKGHQYDIGAQTSNPLKMLFQELRCTIFFKRVYLQACKTNTIDVIIVGMLDDINIYGTLFGFPFKKTPMLGIVMRQHFHFKEMGLKAPNPTFSLTLKRLLFKRLLYSTRDNICVLTIDSTLLEYTCKNYPMVAHRLRYIPDAVDPPLPSLRPELRQEIGIPADAYLILCYGSLRTVKGVQLLIASMKQLPNDIHVLLAGTQDNVIEEYMSSETAKQLVKSKRIHQVNRYIDVKEDADFFNAANLVWVGYKNYYSMSAVLVQSAQFKRPVVASEDGLVGWLTQKYGIGVAVDTTNPAEIVEGILAIRNKRFNVNSEGFDALASMHSLRLFDTALVTSMTHVRNNMS